MLEFEDHKGDLVFIFANAVCAVHTARLYTGMVAVMFHGNTVLVKGDVREVAEKIRDARGE